jgi:hypothetical protein
MLNWADLSSLLVVLAGAMGGLAGAREGNAGVVLTLVLTLGGFLMGLILARVSHGLAYAILRSKKLIAGVDIALYMSVPMLFLLLTVLGTMGLAFWLVRHAF